MLGTVDLQCVAIEKRFTSSSKEVHIFGVNEDGQTLCLRSDSWAPGFIAVVDFDRCSPSSASDSSPETESSAVVNRPTPDYAPAERNAHIRGLAMESFADALVSRLSNETAGFVRASVHASRGDKEWNFLREIVAEDTKDCIAENAKIAFVVKLESSEYEECAAKTVRDLIEAQLFASNVDGCLSRATSRILNLSDLCALSNGFKRVKIVSCRKCPDALKKTTSDAEYSFRIMPNLRALFPTSTEGGISSAAKDRYPLKLCSLALTSGISRLAISLRFSAVNYCADRQRGCDSYSATFDVSPIDTPALWLEAVKTFAQRAKSRISESNARSTDARRSEEASTSSSSTPGTPDNASLNFKCERDMLVAVRETLALLDPDVISCFNVKQFLSTLIDTYERNMVAATLSRYQSVNVPFLPEFARTSTITYNWFGRVLIDTQPRVHNDDDALKALMVGDVFSRIAISAERESKILRENLSLANAYNDHIARNILRNIGNETESKTTPS